MTRNLGTPGTHIGQLTTVRSKENCLLCPKHILMFIFGNTLYDKSLSITASLDFIANELIPKAGFWKPHFVAH